MKWGGAVGEAVLAIHVVGLVKAGYAASCVAEQARRSALLAQIRRGVVLAGARGEAAAVVE